MFHQRAEFPLHLDGLDQARRFFAGCLAEADPSKEHLWVAHVDDNARCVHLTRHDGHADSADLPIRDIVADAARHGSKGLILAHNHPSGDPSPSATDKRLTRRLALVGEAMDIAILAYVVPNQESIATRSELRSFLRQKLPEYMVPSSFVILDALPLMPSGKVDRGALPAPDQDRPELSVTFVAPRTAVERLLVEIWAEVLKVERVGVNDNFFELGGHSLLATQVISRVHNTLHLNLPLHSLFESPTIDGLGRIIERIQGDSSSSPAAAITPISREPYSRQIS